MISQREEDREKMEARRGKQRQPAFQVENVILSLFLEAPVDFVYAAREGHFDSNIGKMGSS